MKKLNRVFFSLGLALVAALTVIALTYMGSRSEGPVGSFLSDIGTLVSRAESSVAHRLRGPGRAASLEWFDEIRNSPERLAWPEQPLLGAFDNHLPSSFDGLAALEQALDIPFPLVHVFTAWGDRPEQRFPRRVAEAIWDLGSVPLITWEPWLSTFERERQRGLRPGDERDQGGMVDVASGVYDFYLKEWGVDAAAFGRPVFVRFGHEMNDAFRYPWGPHNNRPEEYIAAFRHVVHTVREAGGTNVIWVWSPHIAYDDFEAYYPGADVVDWVGTTVLNYGTVAHWSAWWTFDDIFTRKYDRLSRYGKPIMVAELGTIMAGGERAPWFRQALERLPKRLPAVKALVFFHNRQDATITYQALNWAFDRDEQVLRAIRQGIATWDAPDEREAVSE
jgi:hypothetical protein